jgi:hypothetical protein
MRLRWKLMAVLVAVPAAASLGSGPAASAPRSCRWTVFQLPAYHDATHHPGVSSLAAVSAKNVWAAGYWTDPLQGLEHPLAFHWNGKSWLLIPRPGFGPITAVGRTVWLVGKRNDRAYSARWNGRRWLVVRTPGGKNSYLAAAAIVSARDVWAVGQSATGPLLLHWNGKSWARAAGPPEFGGPDASYQAVARIPGTSGFWIFGENAGTDALLASRWDGSSWHTYTIPISANGWATTGTELAADSASSAWIGISVRIADGKYQPWMIHWDGSNWSHVAAPNPGGNGQISGVSAGNPSTAWAIGSYALTPKKVRPFLLRWDGSRWSAVGLPRHAGFSASVAAVPGSNQAWAAGGTFDRYSC